MREKGEVGKRKAKGGRVKGRRRENWKERMERKI